MWKYSAAVLLFLSVAVGPSVPTADLEATKSHPDVDLGDLEVELDDLEVELGDPTEGSERRLRAASSGSEDNQPKHVLPPNKQVSAFLPGNQYKRFLHRPIRDGAPISLVVTPCSAALVGTITFDPDKLREGGKRVLEEIEGPGQVTYSARRGEPGNYDINITARADTYVHFLATDEDLSGLGSLRTNVNVTNRSKSRAEIRWLPGSHSGEVLEYCLITSPTRHFSSMCAGLSAKFGQQPPDGSGGGRRRRQQVAPSPPLRQRAVQNGNITVGCVGKDTVYTLYDLVPGRPYYVSVFGHYVNRNVSFQYGTAQFRYRDPSVRTTLRVREKRVSKLRLSPARPFRRLVLRGPAQRGNLYYFVVSCGGPLWLGVVPRYNSTGQRHRPVPHLLVNTSDDVYDVFVSNTVNTSRLASSADRYRFEVRATGSTTVSVQFQATFRRGWLRVAELPDRPLVQPVSRRRRAKLGLSCTQMALRMPKAKGRRLEYCVLLQLDTSGRQGRRFKAPSACGLQTRVDRSPDNMKRCGTNRQLRRGRRVEVIFDGLIPGQTYVARAMVRPQSKGGLYLPYNLSQVTVPPCSDELPNELPESIISGLEPINERGSGGRQQTAAGVGRPEQPGVRRPGGGVPASQAHAEEVEERHNELSDWTS